MGLFDGFPDLFTDPDVGFGEPVVYTPAGAPTSAVTINAIWTEHPITDGPDFGAVRADVIDLRVDARVVDVPDLAEGDLFERVSSGVVGKAVPPLRPDGAGMVMVTLERVVS